MIAVDNDKKKSLTCYHNRWLEITFDFAIFIFLQSRKQERKTI